MKDRDARAEAAVLPLSTARVNRDGYLERIEMSLMVAQLCRFTERALRFLQK
jgi:hypothetical protein